MNGQTLQRVPIAIDDEQPKLRSIDFVAAQEPMCVYQLADGNVIKAKLVLMSVAWDGVTRSPDGSTPMYQVHLQHLVHVEGAK